MKQPWAWAIAHSGKTVENRAWRPRGLQVGERFLIHAGQGVERVDIGQPEHLPRGVLLCAVTLADVHRADDPVCQCPGQWAEPDGWHWLLADPQEVEQVQLRGQVGLWLVPADVASRLVG